MHDAWYEVVGAEVRLAQGDFIFDCPLSTWAETAAGERPGGDPVAPREPLPELEILQRRREIIAEDVIVMTQACDLEHDKVSDVVLCPHYALSFFRDEVWKPDQERKGQKTNSESWQKYYKAMANGHLWNLCVLNSSSIEGHAIEHRVVDFHIIYTVPRDFLESLLRHRVKPRLRLVPPYREHLSSARPILHAGRSARATREGLTRWDPARRLAWTGRESERGTRRDARSGSVPAEASPPGGVNLVGHLRRDVVLARAGADNAHCIGASSAALLDGARSGRRPR